MAMKKTLSILCVVALGALAGRAVGAREPVPAYAGPLRPAEQVAVFSCGIGIYLKQIDSDGKFTGEPMDCIYALLPGRHEFRISFAKFGTFGPHSKNDYMVTLTLVAGRRYSLDALPKDERNDPMAWVVPFKEGDNPTPWVVMLSDSGSEQMIDVTTVRELR